MAGDVFAADEKTRLRHDSTASRGNIWAGRTGLERALTLLLMVVIITGIALTVELVNSYRDMRNRLKVSDERMVCENGPCIEAAAQLVQSMNQSADPCENFYDFACGGWIAGKHGSGSTISRFTKMNINILLRLKDILGEPITASTPSHKIKTTAFYESCMNLTHRQTSAGKPFLKDLESLGGWPVISRHWNPGGFDWVDLMVKLFNEGLDFNSLMSISVRTDVQNTSNTLITISQPSFGIGDSYWYLFDTLVKSYELMILKIVQLLEPQVDIHGAAGEIADAIGIELRLSKASLSEAELRDVVNHYNIITLAELEKFATKVPWRHLLKKLFPEGTTLTDNEKILLVHPEALLELQEILTESETAKGKKTLANYMLYRVAVSMSRYLSHSFELQYRDFFNLLDRSFFQYRAPWQTCVQTTKSFMQKSVESTYAKEYLSAQAEVGVNIILQGIKDAMREEIRNSTWLDTETRYYALHKLNEMQSVVGIPKEMLHDTILDKYYKTVEIDYDYYSNVKNVRKFDHLQLMTGLHERNDRYGWEAASNLLIANAYYAPSLNELTVPVGILQEGFYDPLRPHYLNYGSLGMIVGHEMMHAFDFTGSRYDADGNFNMWWTNASWNKYLERNECFKTEYSEFEDPVLNETIDGLRTLGENTADVEGLRASYKAYKKWLKHKSEHGLAGLSYSNMQLFWISFASVWCRKQTEKSLESTYHQDLHSPARFRVHGTLSNIREFAVDFKCKLGSTLNPVKKCYLWK